MKEFRQLSYRHLIVKLMYPSPFSIYSPYKRVWISVLLYVLTLRASNQLYEFALLFGHEGTRIQLRNEPLCLPVYGAIRSWRSFPANSTHASACTRRVRAEIITINWIYFFKGYNLFQIFHTKVQTFSTKSCTCKK